MAGRFLFLLSEARRGLTVGPCCLSVLQLDRYRWTRPVCSLCSLDVFIRVARTQFSILLGVFLFRMFIFSPAPVFNVPGQDLQEWYTITPAPDPPLGVLLLWFVFVRALVDFCAGLGRFLRAGECCGELSQVRQTYWQSLVLERPVLVLVCHATLMYLFSLLVAFLFQVLYLFVS